MEKKMTAFNNIINVMKKYFLCTVILFMIFYGLKVCAYAIPDDSIKMNIEKSMEYIREEGLYPTLVYNEKEIYNYAGNVLDNWNDMVFMNASYWGGGISI